MRPTAREAATAVAPAFLAHPPSISSYPRAALVEVRGYKTSGWAGSALVLTATVATFAKIAGVIVAPGARGVVDGRIVNLIDTATGALAYLLTALLVALVCGASFELARARGVGVIPRGAVVAVSGLIVALASPAVVERLGTLPALALAAVTSLVGFAAGSMTLRTAETRAVGGVLSLLALSAFLRIVAWEMAMMTVERGAFATLDIARAFSTGAVALQAFAALLAAAWVGTRSKWRGRILANVAVLVAFGLTWLAARNGPDPTTFEAILRSSLPHAIAVPEPFLLGPIGAFLVPATILLAGVALLQPRQPPPIVAALALALLSGGSFDVPLHALLATASAQWILLAMSDAREPGQRLGVQQPTSAPDPASS